MKKIIIKTICFCIISILLSNILMLAIKNDYSRNSHELNFVLSYHRLDSLKHQKKVIIIAGSNGGFGFDSRIISDSLMRPVVNTCTHAGIGVRMQFEMYKDFISPGDIVIFCPEYYDSKDRLYGDAALLGIISTHIPQAYSKLTVRQWIHLCKYIGVHFKEAIEQRNQVGHNAYSAKSLNEYGDISFYRTCLHDTITYNLANKMDQETLDYYKYIQRFLDEMNASFVYLPPTFRESSYIKNKEQIDAIDKLMTNHHIPYDAKTIRYSFHDSLYYDTPYHLTTEGAKIRTKLVVEDVKRKLFWKRGKE